MNADRFWDVVAFDGALVVQHEVAQPNASMLPHRRK
jgi:hypothetical protein